MSIIAGPLQIFGSPAQINIGTTDTIVGIVRNVFGARYILGWFSAASTSNPITFGAGQACLDGTNGTIGGSVTISGFGSAAANGAGGAWGVWAHNGIVTPGLNHLLFPFVRVFASAPAGATNVTVNIWPIFDEHIPQFARGQNITLPF